jgi:hypothetical protein
MRDANLAVALGLSVVCGILVTRGALADDAKSVTNKGIQRVPVPTKTCKCVSFGSSGASQTITGPNLANGQSCTMKFAPLNSPPQYPGEQITGTLQDCVAAK